MRSASNTPGARIVFPSTQYNPKKRVRPVDANDLVSILVDMEGEGLDDDTIRECIKAVKNAPTIKKRFGKWKQIHPGKKKTEK